MKTERIDRRTALVAFPSVLAAACVDGATATPTGPAAEALGTTGDGVLRWNGDATFSGDLSAASGTFSGTVQASAVVASSSFTATTPVFEGSVQIEGGDGATRVTLAASNSGGQVQLAKTGGEFIDLNFTGSGGALLQATEPLKVRGTPSTVIGDAADDLGFYGGGPIGKPTVTGSKGGNAALADLLQKLAALGLLTDNTT